MEVLYSCIGTVTIAGWEELPGLGVFYMLVSVPSLMDVFLTIEFASAILEYVLN